LVDAISHGAADGLKVALNVIAMLIGFIALIALLDYILRYTGGICANYLGLGPDLIGINLATIGIKDILGFVFSGFAYLMGVPLQDIQIAGSLMGTKMVINEFVAYLDLTALRQAGKIHPKTLIIVSFALCGFANFSSIAIQVGGIGELAPSRRKDLSELGFKALVCGTLASYLSATIAGILV
jgi:CNT family concentrative nucleoside transporter